MKKTTKKRDPEEWYSAIQYIDAFPTERESDEAVLALSQLDGFLAGRTIAPSPAKPGWRAQAFFEDHTRVLPFAAVPTSKDTTILDNLNNLRRVLVRDSMLAAFIKRE
jgi:hypothetical protein